MITAAVEDITVQVAERRAQEFQAAADVETELGNDDRAAEFRKMETFWRERAQKLYGAAENNFRNGQTAMKRQVMHVLLRRLADLYQKPQNNEAVTALTDLIMDISHLET